jgi:hypothetical protein
MALTEHRALDLTWEFEGTGVNLNKKNILRLYFRSYNLYPENAFHLRMIFLP